MVAQQTNGNRGFFWSTIITGKVVQKLFLPSAGDIVIPGLVIMGSNIYLSYYSSHIDHKAQIYLAKNSMV